MILRDNARFAPQADEAGSSQQVIVQGASLASAFSGYWQVFILGN